MRILRKHWDIALQTVILLVLVLAVWTAAEVVYYGESVDWVRMAFYGVRAAMIVVVVGMGASYIVGREEKASHMAVLRFEKIANAIPEGLIGTNSAGKIIYANPLIRSALGRELIGEELVTIIPARFRDAHFSGWVKYMATGDGAIFGKWVLAPMLHANGREIPVQFRIEVVKNGSVQMIALVRPMDSNITHIQSDIDLWNLPHG